MTEEKPKKRRGRPPKTLTDSQYSEVRRLASLTLTQEEISRWFDFSHDTFTRILKRDERFLREYKKGVDEAKANCVQKLREAIDKGELAAIFFYLKTRCGWREAGPADVDKDGKQSEAPTKIVFSVIGKKNE